MKNKTWEKILLSINPYHWTIVKNHPTQFLNGSHALIIESVRYKLIINKFFKFFSDKKNLNILDIGVYPGCIPQILSKTNTVSYNYYGVGMEFEKDFIKEMEKIGVTLSEADLDPRLNITETEKSLKFKSEFFDCVFLHDVIEHFFDPFYLLKEINKVSKLDSLIILTTDNIVRFHHLYALLKGKSINTELIESHIFFDGPWRPHFREYSKSELTQLFNWAGFEVIDHNFFDKKFGSFKIKDGKIISSNRENTFSKKIKRKIIDILSYFFPHLKEHHIMVAKKVKNYDFVKKNSPYLTSTQSDWMDLRKKFS